MLYDLSLRLTASYDLPVSGGRHVLCVTPAQIPGVQRVIESHIDIDPAPAERIARADFFGNSVVGLVFRQPHAVLDINLRARVERVSPVEPEDVSAPLADLAGDVAAVRSLDPDSPHHFLAASTRIRLAPEIAAWARARLRADPGFGPAITTRHAVTVIARALHSEMKFDAGATTVDTPLEEAFARRHGVCQDFSHIMIAALRGLGVPAGYVSGYLRTLPPPGGRRLEGADAMHAWVRAWCGQAAGWIEHDPTNDMGAGPDHIVAGYGRDYSDVPPIRGVLRTAGSQMTGHQVDVTPVEPVPG
jgi:transglutaminase-like putative cysteine protease